jgi:hypothetical protein
MNQRTTEYLLVQPAGGGDVTARPIHWTCKYGVAVDGRVYRFSRDGDYVVRVSGKRDLPVVRFLAVPKVNWTICPSTGDAYRVATYLDDYVVDAHGEEQIVIPTDGGLDGAT